MFPKAYKDVVAAGKAIPDDRYKTQVAVNSEGKTAETTKNVKEPLKKGQTQPTEKQVKMIRNHPSLCLWCGANEWPLAVDIDEKLYCSCTPAKDKSRYKNVFAADR
ncbi:MAG: hypothetical protein LBK58_07370 [Prevotellaceae bacterium]|jgi:beta-galactosidase/beta-glucuronidase|nr:hypothetical protein [Prevotellaceae bacterium]